MPSQRLFDRFEIITRISSGILQVYLAREKSSGDDALVREFPVDGSGWKSEEIADKAKARLGELEPGIDLTHFADADLSADRHRAWVVVWAVKDVQAEAEIAAAAPQPQAVAELSGTPVPPAFPPVAPAAAQAGEFTKMFTPPKPAARHIQTAEPISLAGGNAPPPQAIRNAPAPSAKPMEAGEFTRMFGAPVSAASAPNLPHADASNAGTQTPKPAAPASAASPAGAATNIFDVLAQKSAPKSHPPANPFPDPPAKATDTNGPGFTQVFGSAPVAPMGEPAAVPKPPGAEVKPSPIAQSPQKVDAGGEFTRMFGGAPTAPMGEPAAATKPPVVDPFEAAIAKSAPREGPGLYTQLFSGVKLSAPDPALKGPSKATPSAPPAETHKSGPGEFTQMFQRTPTHGSAAPSHPAASSPFPATHGDGGGGELTQLFTMKTPPAHEPAADPFAAFGSNPPPPSSGAPESLTQILSHTPSAPQRPSAAPPQAPIAAQPTGAGATHIFNQPQPVAPVAPQAPVGPGEYTRIIGAPTIPPAGQAPAPPLPASGGGAFQGAIPQVSGPQVSGPQFSGPQFSGPQISGPQFSGASVTPPSLMAPSMSAPSVQGPYVQAPQMSTPTLQAPSPSATSAPAEKKGLGGYMPLIIILNVLVILAIVLVAYFALIHH